MRSRHLHAQLYILIAARVLSDDQRAAWTRVHTLFTTPYYASASHPVSTELRNDQCTSPPIQCAKSCLIACQHTACRTSDTSACRSVPPNCPRRPCFVARSTPGDAGKHQGLTLVLDAQAVDHVSGRIMLRHSSQRGIAPQHRTRVRTCDSGSGPPNARIHA
jgi:hypothetical protein